MSAPEARWAVEEESTGIVAARGCAPTADVAIREASHYAVQYAQDGAVRWWVREGRKTILKGRMSIVSGTLKTGQP